VGILVGYDGTYIYRVFIPSEGKGKVVRTSHVRFDEGGFITEPDFKAIDDEVVRRQNN
jgi:hypothetical protein